MFKKNITTSSEVQEAEDFLGGGGSFTVPSDIYVATIKNAYGEVAESGAMGVVFEFELEGRENTYTETMYVTNRNGENFYKRNDKEFELPGFIQANDICLVAVGEGLFDIDTEDKLVEVWDRESKKRIPRERPVLVDLIGKTVSLGILETRENKTKKNESTGKWEPVNEEIIRNSINKVWDTESQLTVFEARNEKDPEFYDLWLDKNKGVQRDAYKEVSASSSRPAGKAGSDRPSKMKFGKKG